MLVLVAKDTCGFYSISEGNVAGITAEEILSWLAKGKTLTRKPVVAVFRSMTEARRAYPTLNAAANA